MAHKLHQDLPSGLSHFLCSLALDQLPLAPKAAPAIQSGTWSELEFTGEESEISWDNGIATLNLYGHRFLGDSTSRGILRSLDKPVDVLFADASTLHAEFAAATSQSSNINFQRKTASTVHAVELVGWQWRSSQSARYWAAEIAGLHLPEHNLTIHTGKEWSRRHSRIEANYDLHLVRTDGGSSVLVVDTRGAELATDTLHNDLIALAFSAGGPFELTHLVGFDEGHDMVAVVGFGVAGRDPYRGNRRCPVATARALYTSVSTDMVYENYVPVLAATVALRLETEGPDSPLYMAIDSYLDSLSGRINSSYLLIQVALEALCARILPKQKSRVKDTAEWSKYIDSQEATLRAHLRDDITEEEANGFVSFLRHSAPQPPTTKTVARAFDFMGIPLPDEALKEVKQRNNVAHRFSLVSNSELEPERDTRRLAIIQTLLVAAIAHQVGYDGPIADWTWTSGSRGLPAWWKWRPNDVARTWYDARSLTR